MLDRQRRPLPMWLDAPISFVVLGGLFFLSELAFGIGSGSLTRLILVSSVFGAGMTVYHEILEVRRRRRAGARPDVQAMWRAVRTGGRLPADADPTIWIPELERWRTQFRARRWIAPALVGSVVLVGTASGATDRPALWVLLALYAAISLRGAITTERAIRAIPRLLDELRRSVPGPGAPAQPLSAPDDSPAT